MMPFRTNMPFIVAIVVTCSCVLALSVCERALGQDNSNTAAMKGELTDASGRVIATSEFFGEGTTAISFDSKQRLVVRNSDGKVIAGFEYSAIDPQKSKFTEVFLFQYQDGDKKKWLVMEHKVAKVPFRKGRFSITYPETTLLTNFWRGEEQMTVSFKEVKHEIQKDGRVLNRLVLQSEDARFEFEIEDSRPLYHYLKHLKGDIVSYLKLKGGRSPK